jgi:hypothetical protein
MRSGKDNDQKLIANCRGSKFGSTSPCAQISGTLQGRRFADRDVVQSPRPGQRRNLKTGTESVPGYPSLPQRFSCAARPICHSIPPFLLQLHPSRWPQSKDSPSICRRPVSTCDCTPHILSIPFGLVTYITPTLRHNHPPSPPSHSHQPCRWQFHARSLPHLPPLDVRAAAVYLVSTRTR